MLKILAFVAMAIDHIGVVFFPEYIIFRVIGRLALPLFAFGIARGYSKTKDVFDYGLRIMILALISQPIFLLLFRSEKLNICFTLLFGLIAIYAWNRKNNWHRFIGLMAVFISSYFLNVEYGVYGVLMVLLFAVFKNPIKLIIAQSIITFSYIFLDNSLIIQLFAIPAFFLASYFQHLDFKIKRYLSYLFYPLHLLLLYILKNILLLFK